MSGLCKAFVWGISLQPVPDTVQYLQISPSWGPEIWWNKLEQPKYFSQNPDADHSQATAVETDIPSLTTFIGAYIDNSKLPTMEWEISNITGNITVELFGETDHFFHHTPSWPLLVHAYMLERSNMSVW